MAVASNPIATGWLNENSLREYPFHEGCGLRPNDSTGSLIENGWTIPNCLVVDMSISVKGTDVVPSLYLGTMSVVANSVTLVFFDGNGETAISLYVALENHVKNTSYQISGIGSFSDARGTVCIGDLSDFFSMTPEGVYSFSPDETRVEPTCIRQSAAGVSSLQAIDSTGYTSLKMYGDINLVAGSNIKFDYRPKGNVLIVSADSNAGYSENCDCASNNNDSFVRSINGIAINDVKIVGDEDCVEVVTESGNGVIRIKDKCAKPCCGCAETTFINQTINNLQTTVSTLSANVTSLGDKLTSFITSYVLSRKTLS